MGKKIPMIHLSVLLDPTLKEESRGIDTCWKKKEDKVSTSAKKLKTSHKQYDINVSPTFEYHFIDFLTVFFSCFQY